MDNLTHALAGMLVAEAAVQLRARSAASGQALRAPAPAWRSAAYVACVAGNNLPDIDFLWSSVIPPPFGYLLHHRGHSHTVPGALAFALVLWVAVTAFARLRRAGFSSADERWMFALSLLAPLTHIAMDSSNNYGTHPFWPLYRGWLYGDAVFIVEPFFWAAGIPSLIFAARSVVTRVSLAAVLCLGVGLAFFIPFVPAPMAIALAIVAFGVVLAARAMGPRPRAAFGAGACFAVALLFFFASRVAVSAVRAALGGESARDIVVTPLPANPFCFAVLTVQELQQKYIARRATVATWPAIFPASSCPDTQDGSTAPLAASEAVDTANVHWQGEFVAPLAELVDLAQRNCQAAALLRFFRVPYWVDEDEATLVMGDLRYDRDRALDFADVRIEREPRWCPSAVPSWRAPRHDLLEGR
jgi:inner membrane protein